MVDNNIKKTLTVDQLQILELKNDVETLSRAVDQLCHYIPINQNILMALARLLEVDPKKLGEAIHKPEVNEKYEAKITKAIEALNKKKQKTIGELNKDISNKGTEITNDTKTTPKQNSTTGEEEATPSPYNGDREDLY